MKIQKLLTFLFIIYALIAIQPSFCMEKKHIILPLCEAPIIKEIRHAKNETIDAIAFNPNKNNNILFVLSKKLQSYNVENNEIEQEKLSNNQDTISAFIKENSSRPKCVGPYILNYSDKCGAYTTSMLGGTATVSDRTTNTPLYTIKHADAIKYASFNADHTKLITVSYDNNVKISAIKKPIVVQCEETSITCNPDILKTSQLIDSYVNSYTLPLAITTDQFIYAYFLMTLMRTDNIAPINHWLQKEDINSLCQLVIASDYLDIANDTINLTNTIYKYIIKKYRPKTDLSCVQQLPFYPQNIIAQSRIKDCINYIDTNPEPLFAIQTSALTMPTTINWSDKTIAIAASNCIEIRNLDTKKIKHYLLGKNNDNISIAFSPDNKSLAIGSINNTAQIWDLNTGQVKHTLVGHTGSIYTVSFSSDGNSLATGSWDKTAKIWDLSTGHVKYDLVGHTHYIGSVIFSPDGNYLATKSWDNTVKIWDLNTGHIKYTLAGHTNFINSVIFSPDGKYLATGSRDETAKIWNLDTGHIKYTLVGHDHYISSVIFSPDGNYLVTISWNNAVKIWDLSTGQIKYTLTEPTHPINAITISPDSKNLTTVSKDKTIKIWDLLTGQVNRTLAGKTQYIDSINFSPDGLKLAGKSDNEILKIWDLDDTPKQTFLNELTIEQADFITEKAYPVIQQNFTFKFRENSKEHKIWMTFLPAAQQYLKGHIQIALPYQ